MQVDPGDLEIQRERKDRADDKEDNSCSETHFMPSYGATEVASRTLPTKTRKFRPQVKSTASPVARAIG
jgi:hypothetical protein